MNQTVSSRAGTAFRPKTAAFAMIAAMTLYVLYHNERFLIDASDPNWQHIATFKWWLLLHGASGAPALLLAPLQFSDRLRSKHARLHRIVGRIYVFGALVLAPLGAYIQYVQEPMGAPRSFTVLGIADAVLLVTVTAIAFLFAVRRRITLHRQWMTRSYAVALVFFEGRFVMGITGWGNDVVSTQTTIWVCLVFAVLVGDIANNWADLRSAVTTAPSRQTTTSARYGIVEPTA